MATEKRVKPHKDIIATGLFLAGLFLGLGIGGAIYKNYAAGALIGLAVGFLAATISRLVRKTKK